MRHKLRIATIVVAVGALLGVLFASVSTSDFAMHLDRQVHDVHCSFIPGAAPEPGESGCQVTLVSPYSSVFRGAVWGGVPISLPAIAVFAFLLLFATEVWLMGRQRDVRATGFLALAAALPLLTSLVMAYLSMVELDAVCKLCIGIYVASALCFGGAVALFVGARKAAGGGAVYEPEPEPEPDLAADAGDDPAWVSAKSGDDADEVVELTERKPSPEPAAAPAAPTVSWGYLGAAFAVGVLFVVAPVTSYVVAAPDHSKYIGACGGLVEPDDPYGVMVALDAHPGGVPAVEILDPLCPACRGFERALASSGLDGDLDRKALLFPLDNTCNWMVDSAVHPGACVVSYAMLCAEGREGEVLDWAFDHQEAIRKAETDAPGSAQRMVDERFPELSKCVGSPAVKSRLNRSLRWAVANRLPVLTPQLYVGGAKLCDEDVDLGLEFALSRLVQRHRDGTLVVTGGEAAPVYQEPRPEPKPPANPTPPAEAPPADTPSADTPSPPADTPPADKPPADTPPADKPPADKPPADTPPADDDTPALPPSRPLPVETVPDEPAAPPEQPPPGDTDETETEAEEDTP